jgi:hypothetical protein
MRDEMADFRNVQVALGGQRSTTLDELLRGWEAHVRVLERELANARDTGWSADDLVAALLIRDRIEKALPALGSNDRVEAKSWLQTGDLAFEAMTEIDDRRLVRLFARDESQLPGKWWWTRIPRRGPIRIELEEWFNGPVADTGIAE